jgi:hypothetical protein
LNHNYHRRYGQIADANIHIDAWKLSQQVPTIREDYEGQADLYQWPEAYRQFSVSPHWAYWFARHVICDHWPGAEHFTLQAVERFTWPEAHFLLKCA